MPHRVIANEMEFRELMERVDRQLHEQGVPIPARPFHAESLIAVELGEEFVHPTASQRAVEGSYTGDDLTIRVHEWFDERYDERLKVDFTPGRFIVHLRGDTWHVRIPRLYGQWEIVTSGDSSPGDMKRQVAGEPPSRLNCLDAIDDLPRGLREDLTSQEKLAFKSVFRLATDAFHAFEALRSSKLAAQARADVDATVQHLLGQSRNAALAKWSTLQTAEKMLKEYIHTKGGKYQYIHNLSKLSRQAESLGLSPVPEVALQAVQCAPDVRYGSVSVPIADAVHAHHASLQISLGVAQDLGVPSIFSPPSAA